MKSFIRFIAPLSRPSVESTCVERSSSILQEGERGWQEGRRRRQMARRCDVPVLLAHFSAHQASLPMQRVERPADHRQRLVLILHQRLDDGNGTTDVSGLLLIEVRDREWERCTDQLLLTLPGLDIVRLPHRFLFVAIRRVAWTRARRCSGRRGLCGPVWRAVSKKRLIHLEQIKRLTLCCMD